jgi:hypothetical protein
MAATPGRDSGQNRLAPSLPQPLTSEVIGGEEGTPQDRPIAVAPNVQSGQETKLLKGEPKANARTHGRDSVKL